MSETPDPVAALAAKDLATRAAGARDLAASGLPEHLPRLVELAMRDPSPGVRLGCAGAAADILSRWRLPPKAATISEADRLALWQVVRGVDPGVNPGIFQVCGTLNVPAAIDRIIGGARDPRADVRLGACVGLWRLCTSAAANGDAALEGRVVALLDDSRIRAETHAEIAKLCATVGYTSAIERVRALSESTARTVSTVAGEALQRLEWPLALTGIWADLGVDAGAVQPEAEPGAVVAIPSANVLIRATERSVRKENLAVRPRRLWIKRPGGTEPSWAIQIGNVTYWEADGDEIGTFGDRLLSADAFDLFALVEPLLPVSAASARLRGVAKLRAGDTAGALEYLEAAVEMKKVPTDTWWFLADTLHALGRDEEAKPHLEKYLSKAAKRAPYVAEAKRRLEG